MASEENSPLIERLINSRNRDISLILPLILGLTTQTPDGETQQNTHERIILINPFTQGMIVIEGNLDSLLRDIENNIKGGQPPASKASIDALPEVKETSGGECVVCLEEFSGDVVVKEMPCKHRFHGECIEKWLGLHGSCPVCRYNMPADEGKKRDDGDEGRRVEREIWVTFSIGRGRNREDSSTENVSSDDSYEYN